MLTAPPDPHPPIPKHKEIKIKSYIKTRRVWLWIVMPVKTAEDQKKKLPPDGAIS